MLDEGNTGDHWRGLFFLSLARAPRRAVCICHVHQHSAHLSCSSLPVVSLPRLPAMINDMRRLPAEERDQGKESIHHRSASRKTIRSSERARDYTSISKRSVVYHPCLDKIHSKVRWREREREQRPRTCRMKRTVLVRFLFVQGTALLMMIELVKRVISHARVIAFCFFFVLYGPFRLSACWFYLSMCIYIFVKCK